MDIIFGKLTKKSKKHLGSAKETVLIEIVDQKYFLILWKVIIYFTPAKIGRNVEMINCPLCELSI